MAVQPVTFFGKLLRRCRLDAGLTQEELAEAAGLDSHTISDLERGHARKPHAKTVRLLAEALNLTGPAREDFEAAARRYNRTAGSSATTTRGEGATLSSRLPRDPREWLTFIVAALDEAGEAAARSAVTRWEDRGSVDDAWLAWVERLITLTAEGRMPPTTRRPIPTPPRSPFFDREQQSAELNDFINQTQQGRGGLALVLGLAGIGKSRLLVNVLADRMSGMRVEWVTFDRSEAGYQGWRRLLAPLWIMLRRTELAPAGLVSHASILDDILLAASDNQAAGRLFPGEVAAAIAAMLMHIATRQPLMLVIDDAHRGGTSSDRLLLDIARRVNAAGIGLIAALRPDELEDDSPLRGYTDQADGRAAVDLVAPIRVPPLGLEATAGLIRERTGIEPPSGVVEQVLRKTGGCPQLINGTEIQRQTTGTNVGSWSVSKLNAKGLRVLEETIHARPEEVRTVLCAAALHAVDVHIEPTIIARITDLDDKLVERILDKERREGSILAPQANGYRFQHDNWIDALANTCPPAQKRLLHAQCLELLRDDPASDPRELARHAIGAGPRLIGKRELVTLTSNAADIAMVDYAFGAAAELYEVAVRYAASAEQIDLLVKRADALRFRGGWGEARSVLKLAASLARTLGMPDREAMALAHLERLTWTYGYYEMELTQQIRDVLERLPPDEMVLRAQARASLTTRLTISVRQYDNEAADLARTALKELPSVTDPLVRASMIVGIRSGLQDSAPPEELLTYDRQILDLAVSLRSAFHLEEALSARIIDIIRAGRLSELSSAIRAYRDFAEQSATAVAVYTQVLIDGMLALARGDFDAARKHTDEAVRLSESWGDSMAHEALMGQIGWLLYEIGQVDGLTEMIAQLVEQDVSSVNETLWSLAAGLIHAEKDETGQAIHIFREVCMNTSDFKNLSRGLSRIGILATAAMVLGHPAVSDKLQPDEAARLGNSIADLLAAHPDTLVLAGWPSVILGSKHRYIGLAYLAARQFDNAIAHLSRAVAENSDFAVLETRTRFDLARALIKHSGRHSQGVTEMKSVAARAAEFGMARLAAQAVAEINNIAHPFTDP